MHCEFSDLLEKGEGSLVYMLPPTGIMIVASHGGV
jgi:hypothetical protein